jgi:probable rRNA maturation factor
MGGIEVDDRCTVPLAGLPPVEQAPIQQAPIHQALVDQARFMMRALGLHPDVELAISLVDPAEMADLHLRWMDLPGPTDVLSFPMDELRVPGPGEHPAPGVLGDVVICPQVAQEQGARAGHGLAGELELLLTHGILHLLGHDHAEPAEHAAMFGLQDELLDAWRGSR